MKQKDLDREGITKAYLSTLNIKSLGNPVQLLPNDEPLKLLKCMGGFWVLSEGSILKNEKNEYLVVSEKEALIGRARYLLNFSDEIKQEKINQEVIRLKNLTDSKLDYVLSNIEEALIYAGRINPPVLRAILCSQMVHLESEKLKRERALEIVDDGVVDLFDRLKAQKDLGTLKDYNSLYDFLFQDNTMQIASFELLNPNHMEALVRSFSATNILNTVIEIQSSEHLYNIAKFNIEKTQ